MSKVPKLRFQEFSEEWEEKQLGDICEFSQGIQIPYSEQISTQQDGYIRYLYIRDFFTNDFACYVKDIYQNKIICTNEIMMVNTGNTAGKAFMGATGVLSNNSFKISFNHKIIDNNFLFAFLMSDSTQSIIQSFFNGGGQPHLGHKNIAMLPFHYTLLQEQQKIASFLFAIDTKIDQLTRKKELLEQYKKGVMQKIFSQELRYKADDGSEFSEWEEKKISDVLKIGSGKDYKHLENGDVPVYGTGGYMLSVSDYLYEGESVCIGRKGTIDKPMFLDGKFWTVDTLFYTHSFKDSIPKFIFYVFQTINWKLYNEASGVPSLSKSTIEKIVFSFPPIDEQTKIANFLTSIDAKITLATKQLEEVKKFKKGLLQQMFV